MNKLVIFALAVVAIPNSIATAVISPREPETACRQIDLSKYFAKAGAKVIQVAEYYNVTTYTYENVTVGNDTWLERVETQTPTFFNLAGSATIIDACSFQLDNFTISSVPTETYWYGKMSSNYTVGSLVSWYPVVAMNDTKAEYALVDGVTFESIDTLIMYSKAHELQLAYVTFPRVTLVPGGSESGSTGPTGGGGSTVGKNDTSTSSRSAAPRRYGDQMIWSPSYVTIVVGLAMAVLF